MKHTKAVCMVFAPLLLLCACSQPENGEILAAPAAQGQYEDGHEHHGQPGDVLRIGNEVYCQATDAQNHALTHHKLYHCNLCDTDYRVPDDATADGLEPHTFTNGECSVCGLPEGTALDW